jgi:hypothetical protein
MSDTPEQDRLKRRLFDEGRPRDRAGERRMSDLIEKLDRVRDASRRLARETWGEWPEFYRTMDGLFTEAAAALRAAKAREAALVEALEEIGQYTITCSMMSTNASSFIMGKVSAALAAAKGDAQPPNAQEPPPAGARGMNLE